jgi:hypothetical protein
MTEKQQRPRSIISRLMARMREQVFDPMMDEFEAAIRKRVDSYMKEITKMFLVSIVGAVFVAGGLLFLFIGIIKLLSTLMPNWVAWAIVGIMMALIGALAFMSMRKR